MSRFMSSKGIRWLVISILLTLGLIVSHFLPALGITALLHTRAGFRTSQATTSPRTVYTHLFEWKWQDIANECENFLGPQGYAAVQVSPPQEHRLVQSFPWYQRYQPVSYKLESRSGSRADFVDMVKRCKNAGVDIYVDAVINHMTGVLEPGQTEIGSAGSPFSRYNYLDYNSKDFHDCGRNGNNDIQNWQDRYEVQNCELLNLSDLDTGSAKVRSRIAGYLNDLTSLGVAGFRIDAAKHIPTTDLAAILRKVQGKPYIYQEVIATAGEPLQPPEYFPNGDITEFRYSLGIAPIFRNGKLADLRDFVTESTMIPTDKAVVFIDNHDNQRGHGTGNALNYKEGQLYILANVFMLALPYGYPQVMSSYKFEDSSQGPPSDAKGNTKNIYNARGKNVGCFKEWVCEHRHKAIANMVSFHNYTNGSPVSNWWSNGHNQIAFARGSQGFIVINRENSSLSRQFQTNLPAGTYCNVVTAELTSDGKSCSGDTVTVDTRGFASIQVAPQNAVAIYGGKKVRFKP